MLTVYFLSVTADLPVHPQYDLKAASRDVPSYFYDHPSPLIACDPG